MFLLDEVWRSAAIDMVMCKSGWLDVGSSNYGKYFNRNVSFFEGHLSIHRISQILGRDYARNLWTFRKIIF